MRAMLRPSRLAGSAVVLASAVPYSCTSQPVPVYAPCLRVILFSLQYDCKKGYMSDFSFWW